MFKQWSFLRGPQGEIHYRLEGKAGDRVVVICHGLTGNLDSFKLVGFALLDTSLIDLYGCGLSESVYYDVFTGYHYTGQFFVDQLEYLLNRLELLHKPVTLLCFGLGWMIGLNFACVYPDLVEKLVAVSPAGLTCASERGRALISSIDFIMPIVRYLIPRCWITRSSYVARCSEDDRCCGRADLQWQRLKWLLYRKRRGLQGYLAILLRVPCFPRSYEVLKRLNQVNIPLLVMWGTSDSIAPFQDVSLIVSHVHNHHLIYFHEGTHLLYRERSSECLSLIATFLDLPRKRCDTGDGEYREPEERRPGHLSVEEYHKRIRYTPKRRFNVCV